jgi:hypothetical protein
MNQFLSFGSQCRQRSVYYPHVKTKLLTAFFWFLALAALANGPVFQTSPFMQGVFGTTNSPQQQTDSGFSQFSNIASVTVIGKTVAPVPRPPVTTVSKAAVSIPKAGHQTPYAWETNGWFFDWWKPQTARPISGSTVTSYSGCNGNTLIGTATYDPVTMHGHPGITQPSAGNGMGNPALLGTIFENSGTFAIVFCWTKPSSLPGAGEVIAGASTSGNTYYWKLVPTDPNASGNLYMQDGGIGPSGLTGGNITLDSSPLNNVHVFLATWINGVYLDYIDGALINNVPLGAYWPLNFPWNPGFMGGFYLGNNYDFTWTFSGAEGEFLLSTNFASAQIADEIQTLFLSDNGALRKTLEMDGDSIVAGVGASLGGDLDSYIDPDFAGWQVINCGIPGATTSGILTDQLYRAHGGSSVLPYVQIFYSNLNNNGRGDASQAGTFLATITNDMMAWATNVTATGHIPLLVVPPSNPYTDTNGERALFINWATNCALNYFAPPLIRLDLAPVGTNGAWQNPVFFPTFGNPHGTNAFYASIAPYFPAAVKAALAVTNFIQK